jgi:hypothetical protein
MYNKILLMTYIGEEAVTHEALLLGIFIFVLGPAVETRLH